VTAHPAAGLADGLADGAARDLVDRLVSRPAVAGVVGVGIDAVDLARLRTVLARRPRLSGRLFTPGEQAYAALAPDPVPRLGTRFAAKEAVMKALGVGLWSFRLTDVEVVRIGLDAPGVVLHGAAADLARAAGVRRWHLSLTHTDSLALAAVVADGTPGEPVAGADAVEGP
jgi:holo-[acyl-carrier protein] synthase